MNENIPFPDLGKHLTFTPRDQELLRGVVKDLSRERPYVDATMSSAFTETRLERIDGTRLHAQLRLNLLPHTIEHLLGREKLAGALNRQAIAGALDTADLSRGKELAASHETRYAFRVEMLLAPIIPESLEGMSAKVYERLIRAYVPLRTLGKYRFDTRPQLLLDGTFLAREEIEKITEYVLAGTRGGMTLPDLRTHFDQLAYHALVYPDLETLKK